MTQPHWLGRHALSALAGLLAGLLLASAFPLIAQPPAAPQALAPFAAEAPLRRSLDSSLYMQTAAEYRACCYQAYNLAAWRLLLAHTADKDVEPPHAVVLDLDETVLDNSGFQAMLARSGLTFDQRLWELWQEKAGDHVALIPGAKEFIKGADDLKVDLFYISNRDEKYRTETTKMLERLGIGRPDAKYLKLKTTSSDKTARRKEVEAKYKVLLYLGDNLRDFDEDFKCSVKEAAAVIQERKDKVTQTRTKWGEKWIILPNPVYGEWTVPLVRGEKDLELLVPTAPRKQ